MIHFESVVRRINCIQHNYYTYYTYTYEVRRHFPRARRCSRKGKLYFCDLIIMALTFEHIAENRTVVVRALYI